MTILDSDIKLLASERMADTTDGGGRRTSSVIQDGVAGNIFQKVSRLDSVYGRVNLRKVYAHVDTENSDIYAGAHAAIIDAADNSKIKVNIFTTGSDFDDRTAARDRIESYVVSGPETRMVLYGRQLAGQKAITVYQRTEEPLPSIGDVLCLSQETAGVVGNQQYVRIEEVKAEDRTFTDDQGDFKRKVVIISISIPLRFDFAGVEGVSRLSGGARAVLVRSSSLADASRYYGIANLALAAPKESLEIHLDSIYSPIVPTTQREAPVSQAHIEGAVSLHTAGTTVRTAWHHFGQTIVDSDYTETINVGRAITPGSLLLKTDNLANNYGGPTTTDDGKGNIIAIAGFLTSRIYGGTVDYASGSITISARWAYPGFTQGGTWVSFIPAAEVSQPAHTRELPITLANRGTVFVQSLLPLPATGSVFLDYRALGRWYRLRDDGTGALLGGDPADGSGTIDPVTGALVVTVGALPDVGSSVMIGWASPVHYAVHMEDADTAPKVKFSIPTTPVAPGSLQITYTAGGVQYTGIANGAGVIAGNGLAGTVNGTTGEVELSFTTRLPDAGTTLDYAYNMAYVTATGQPSVASGSVPLAAAPWQFSTEPTLAPGTLTLNVPYHMTVNPYSVGGLIPAMDDGSGNIVTKATSFNTLGNTDTTGGQFRWRHAGGAVIGTVNYSNGQVTLTGDIQIDYSAWGDYFVGGPGWLNSHATASIIADDFHWSVQINTPTSVTNSAGSVSLQDSPLTLRLLKTITNEVVPGSVVFMLGGKEYVDRQGAVYTDIQANGAGTQAGTIDYSNGSMVITYWGANAAPAVSITACLTKYGNFTMSKTAFRTAGSPLRPTSTVVQVTAQDGETLVATADADANLVGTGLRGTVNQQMGVVSIEWGAMVAAAGNETQPWYDASAVVGGQIWKPRAVMPETLQYDTVVLSNLPLDANQLGLDPVRLPADGRVPIFRAGDVVLLHNTKTTQLAAAVAGATQSVSRAHLAYCVLLDAIGAAVPANQYTVDLDAGTVTFSPTMNLTGYVEPLVARHRIEDLNMATDAQINGQVSLSGPLSQDFDEDTKVSSCLLFGDLFARVSNIFDQVSWTNAWSDARVGSDGAAAYNSILFPILVNNAGAVTDRWRINFTDSAGNFQVIGENSGVIATGKTTLDCAPVNPLTGEAYFTIRSGGWGAGWTVGNQLRFNTYGASGSIWMVRTVLPGASLSGDSIDLQVRGDTD